MEKLTKAQKVYDIVKNSVDKNSKILEISCGRGEILWKLKQDGYSVRGTNYTKYEGVMDGIDIDNGINLLNGLPYDDNSFDCIILIDVIEHISDHDKALKEISRVCSENGIFLILSPNIMKISSRLHFMATGFFKIKRSFVGFDVPYESAFAFHNYPPHLPTFLYQLKSHHFNVYKIDAYRYKMKSHFMLLPFYLYILATSYYKIFYDEKYLKKSDMAPFLFKILTSYPLLCGESWILVTRKLLTSSPMTTSLPRWSKKHIN